ncbi:MAG: DUF2089 domain-containing protein [Anaerolineae bacterium]
MASKTDHHQPIRRLLTVCPVCSRELVVARLECDACATAIEGRFGTGPFGSLTAEQLDFVATFVRCEGKFTRMEEELGLSYPTLRGRLRDIIALVEHDPAGRAPDVGARERRRILRALEEGDIDAGEALKRLRGHTARGSDPGAGDSDPGGGGSDGGNGGGSDDSGAAP